MTLKEAEQQLYIPFNELGYEVVPEVQHLGRTKIQIRFDTRKSEARLLPLRINREIYTILETKRDKTDSFYSDTHKRMGLSKDTVNDRVQRLWEDMNRYGLWPDELLVVQDPKELVFNSNLEYGKLPAILQGTSVEVRGSEKLEIADKEHGMTTDEFIKAGGKFFGGEVLAYLSQYPYLTQTHDVSQDLKILGLRKGDRLYTNLDPKHSYGIKTFRAFLCPSGGGSDVGSDYGLEVWRSDRGAVVGRKMSAATSHQERINEAANQLERMARQLRNEL